MSVAFLIIFSHPYSNILESGRMLHTDIDKQDARLNALEEENEAVKKENEALKKEDRALKKELEALKKELKDIKKMIAAFASN